MFPNGGGNIAAPAATKGRSLTRVNKFLLSDIPTFFLRDLLLDLANLQVACVRTSTATKPRQKGIYGL
jgi:hypothetical protein